MIRHFLRFFSVGNFERISEIFRGGNFFEKKFPPTGPPLKNFGKVLELLQGGFFVGEAF